MNVEEVLAFVTATETVATDLLRVIRAAVDSFNQKAEGVRVDATLSAIESTVDALEERKVG